MDAVELLQKARKTKCIVTGIPHRAMLKLRDKLKNAGIDANIVTGGLQVYANYQDDRVVRICTEFGAIAEPGVSRFYEDSILRGNY